MKKKSTLLLDEHLLSLKGMQEAGTDDFFYTRLKARMLAKQTEGESNWNFSLRPVWVVASMALLLVVNVFILSQQNKSTVKPTISSNSLQSFAESYDQTISSY